ncbi:hypothetical protein [Devosia soli]|uniref:hypothetical protein n=1 Tax=Devosia soli TaxID=361041 RepID=UPI0006201C34|nr:hypothetical protein [Devosia soli]
MPTKFQSESGAITPSADATHKFPVYYCEECGAPNAGFGMPRAEGRLSYCGWDGFRPVCVGKGKPEGAGLAVPPSAPW